MMDSKVKDKKKGAFELRAIPFDSSVPVGGAIRVHPMRRCHKSSG